MTNYPRFDYDGFTFEFSPRSQGFQLTVTKGEKTIYDYLMILQTQFEALMSAASEIYGDTIEAESIAQAGGIAYRFSDDADCRDCEYFGDYSEMTATEDGEYLCDDCAPKNLTVADLLEEAPSYAEAVADLYRWSTNYDYQTGTPYWAFLDLIGYSADEYGAAMNPATFTLDYASAESFAAALNEWSVRPTDVIAFIDKIQAAD